MKPLVLHIVVLSAIIISIQAEHTEAKVKKLNENQEFDISYNGLEDELNHVYHLRSSLEDIKHEHMNSASSNEAQDSEAEIETEVEDIFPYELYSKVKVTLPPSNKYQKHVLTPVLVDAPVPVKILIDQPFPVEKRVPVYYPVKIDKPYPVNMYIPVPVKVKVPVKKQYPVFKDVPVAVPVYVEKRVPKFVERPYPVLVYRKNNGTQGNMAEQTDNDGVLNEE